MQKLTTPNLNVAGTQTGRFRSDCLNESNTPKSAEACASKSALGNVALGNVALGHVAFGELLTLYARTNAPLSVCRQALLNHGNDPVKAETFLVRGDYRHSAIVQH